MTSVVGGLTGVAGTGVVHRNREFSRSGPESRRFMLVTGFCQVGRPSTSVWSSQNVRRGALIRISVR
ncbi:hypothetical protein ACWDRB_56380 [Nonomuraea sp. NPDC003707]